jgi:hypothetical protein
VGPFISGDEAEVIGIGKSDDLCFFKRVSELVFKALEGLEDGVKHHEEDNGTERIALEDSSLEAEWF